MASNYTEHYDLCQWEPTDAVQRVEFNQGNAKLDAALAELETAKQRLDRAAANLAYYTGRLTARELYEDGLLGRESMALYELLEQEGGQPAHQLKRLAGLTGKRSGRFDAAMVQLQMRLLVSICGQTRKRNALGQEYGWQVACYECVERRFGQGELPQPGQALEALTDRACGALAVDRRAVRALLDPFHLVR